MLREISAQCVAHDLHTIALGHLSVHVGDSSQRSEEVVQNLKLRFLLVPQLELLLVLGVTELVRFLLHLATLQVVTFHLQVTEL